MGLGQPRLSVLILAKNEAEKIAHCLEAVTWAHEIFVVDDMSTDATAAICRRYGAKVIQRSFDNFSDQANFGLEHLTGEWVLSLDADEVVTPALRDEIQGVLARGADCAGFTFKRLNYFLGHRMRYGGWYHDVLHLFRRSSGRFRGKVHHTPHLSGKVRHLEAAVEHYPFTSLLQFVERQNRYTSMEARELVELRGVADGETIHQDIVFKPLKLTWKFYVKKQGFREGMYGLIFSVLFAWVHFVKWAKYWELGQQQSRPAEEPGSQTVGSVGAIAHA